MKKYFVLFIGLLLVVSCKTDPKIVVPEQKDLVLVDAPIFNEDSAFHYILKQVEFGPRVPNSAAHKATGLWLVETLDNFADEVVTQEADLEAFDGTILESKNIIASFNLEAKKRILLSAHWDTRPFADQDNEKQQEPIAGANDGASGVAVLLEIARLLHDTNPGLGIDIILFDSEDYGQPNFSTDDYMPDSYCLGSQYWAKNPHVANYTANFGILLDMVGAPNAVFTHEGTSVNYANHVLQKIWKIAHELGYSSYFSYVQTPAITDDHLYVNAITKIPMIDIIQYDKTTESGFGWYWHTHQDDIDAIDKKTLKAVGQTVIQSIFQEAAE